MVLLSRIAYAGCLLLALISSPGTLRAQGPASDAEAGAARTDTRTDDDAGVGRLIAALLGDTPLERDLRQLTREIGGRATGSEANRRSVEWALARFRQVGVSAREEPFAGNLPPMAKQNSFDVVSKIKIDEVKNAVNQALKEVFQRFDLKGTNSSIELDDKQAKLVLGSADEYKLKAVIDILQSKLVKRGVSLKALEYGAVVPAAKASVRQTISIQQGIPVEKAREIVKIIKKTKLKVQVAIQADSVRVSGKDRDTLQEVIALLKEQDLGIDMQFENYR